MAGLTANLHDLDTKTSQPRQTSNSIAYTPLKEESTYAEERPNRPPPMAYRVTLKARAAPPSKNAHSRQQIRGRVYRTVGSQWARG